MNILCKRLMHDRVRLVASRMFSVLVATLLPAVAYAGSYFDLRRIEPIRGDMTSGAAKTIACVACHGPSGNSIVPQFPSLASQRADYLYHRLVAFKAVNPKDSNYASSPMPAQTQNLSDQDMRNIALYFAAQAQIPQSRRPRRRSMEGAKHFTRAEIPRMGCLPVRGVMVLGRWAGQSNLEVSISPIRCSAASMQHI